MTAMTKQHRIRSAVVGLARAGAVVLCLSLSPSAARANDLVDCVAGWAKATLNPEQIKNALDFLANHSQCLGYLSDPTGQFAAIVGAVVAVDQAGGGKLLTSAETCQQAVPNLLADIVEKVADSGGGAIGLEIPKSVKDQGHEAVVQWVNSLKNEPPISTISAELDCACAVAATGKEALQKILEDVADTAKACGGVIGDIAEAAEEVANGIKDALEQAGKALAALGEKAAELVDCLATGKSAIECAQELGIDIPALFGPLAPGVDAFLDALGSFLGWVKEGCCDTIGTVWGAACGGCDPPDPPEPPDLNCQGVVCKAGLQCGGDKHDHCVPCADAGPTVTVQADGTCGCINGFSPKTQPTAGGPVVVGCACEAPKVVKSLIVTAVCTCPHEGEVLQYAGSKLSCGCPLGKGLKNGKCVACEAWQKSAGGQCQDLCPNGVWVDPNAPAGTPKVSLQSPGAPHSATATPSIPGQGGPAQLGQPGNVVATPSAVGLPGSGGAGGVMAMPSGMALPGSGGGTQPGGAISATPVLVPMCLPCGPNEYLANNKCHDCGTKAVVNVSAKTCTPCGQGQVAKLMGGTLTCAADCSRFGRVGANVRLASNYITDPNDKNRCVACGPGSKANDTHTACITTVAIGSQPTGPVTATGVPEPLPTGKRPTTREKGKGTVVRVDPDPPQTKRRPETKPSPANIGRQKSKTGTTAVRISCPPRTHPNPRGTGCVPDVAPPGISGAPSRRPAAPAPVGGTRIR